MNAKAKKFSIALGATVMAAVLVLSGCSDEENSNDTPIIGAVADSLATVLVDGLVESTQIEAVFASAANEDESAEPAALPPEVKLSGISDVVLVGSRLFAGYEEGLIIHDLADKSTISIATDFPVRAVVLHGGKVYVGGEKLAIVDGVDLNPVQLDFEGTINEMASVNLNLMVGTEKGLYTRSILGDEVLLDEMSVTAIVPDGSGVWIGTDGQGLYRWDGDEFVKRFLARDSSLFDFVTCLAYNHSHLYVGTDNGMYVHDGGQWTTLTIADGLPSNSIIALDASSWVTYIATDAGVTSYFNGDFTPVRKLADKSVNSLIRMGRKIIVGTEYEGLLMKSGPSLKTLVDPDLTEEPTGIDVFSISM